MMSDQGWYIGNQGQTIGPMSRSELGSRLSDYQGPETLVYGPGAADWMQARHVAGLLSGGVGAVPPPPAPASRRAVDEIDYEVYGDDMQFVEVTLDPGESVIAEAGTMMYMSQGIRMETVMGDPGKDQGLFGKLVDAGKRAVTGESLFLTVFTAGSSGRDQVSFAAPYPGKIIPMQVGELGGEILCQKDAFLCAAKGINIGIAFQKKIGAGLFGGEGFILQRLLGDGLAFAHAGGTIHRRELATGETLRLDTGCLVAFQPSVNYDIQFTGGIKNSLFGGEGLFLATLTGPGTIWLQSLPFSRLAGRMLAGYSQNKGEGSILGELGSLFEAK